MRRPPLRAAPIIEWHAVGGTRRDVAKHAIEIYESADVGKVRPVMGIRAG